MSATTHDTRNVTIPVTGMSCGGCAASVQRALANHAGVTAAAVDLARNSATVEFDPAATSAGALVETIRAAGYGAALPNQTA